MNFTSELCTYKVTRRHWWSRGWQAEFEGIVMCPRAWTKRGARRRGARLQRMSLERRLIRANRTRRFRAHITRRSDPYYAELRKLGRWTFSGWCDPVVDVDTHNDQAEDA